LPAEERTLPRRRRPPEPKPVLLFSGISENQWRFLRLRSFDHSDAQAARSAGISPRIVESWKKRSNRFLAVYSLALGQPRLFASGQLVWRLDRLPAKQPATEGGLSPVGALYSREQDSGFVKELRSRELTSSTSVNQAPTVDLDVPAPYRRPDSAPRETGPGERALAEVLGVEHCVVLGHWNGKPTLERGYYEKAVDVAREFTPRFRIEAWYPDYVLITSAGLIVVADGTPSRDLRCPLKSRHRCPLVDLRGAGFASCSYWDLALANWLDTEPPSSRTPMPICHRDFGIARMLAYVAAATMRPHGDGWSAGFPVIAVRDDPERAYWERRVRRWNELVLDPWHRIRVVDRAVIIEAAADFRVNQEHRSWSEDSPTLPTSGRRDGEA
jgi:hypothetical protein